MSLHSDDNSITSKCFSNAVKFLSIRDHSEYELITKLKKKGYNSKTIESALSKCREYKYLDDEKFALKFFNTRVLSLYGPFKIRMDLKNKRVADHIIEQLIGDYEESPKEYETARRYFLKSRYKIEKKKEPRKKSEAYFRIMSSRGFSRSVIMDIHNEAHELFNP